MVEAGNLPWPGHSYGLSLAVAVIRSKILIIQWFGGAASAKLDQDAGCAIDKNEPRSSRKERDEQTEDQGWRSKTRESKANERRQVYLFVNT